LVLVLFLLLLVSSRHTEAERDARGVELQRSLKKEAPAAVSVRRDMHASGARVETETRVRLCV
ncbi:hypothetical protein PDJAM_G00093280, partial [Pangasius djambal]|nr:hypothetical protein [Pangasius djambal]